MMAAVGRNGARCQPASRCGVLKYALKARQVGVSRLPCGDRRQPEHRKPAAVQARFSGGACQDQRRSRNVQLPAP
jgi:hypothetical protein